MIRGILLLLALMCALTALASPQDQGRPTGRQSGWYSSRSRGPGGRRPPYNQPNLDDNQPSYGSPDDYGSRDPNYGRRTRPGRPRRPEFGGYDPRPQPQPRPQPPPQPPLGLDPRLQPPPQPHPQPPPQPRPQPPSDPHPQPPSDPRPQPPSDPRPQPLPDTIRQPVFGGYDPRPQPPLDTPRQPVFGGYDPRPQPPPDTPRQPVFGGYDPRPQPPPDTPREPVFGGYDPRPQPPLDTSRQPSYGGYDPRPRPPPDTPRQPVYGGYDPRPQPQPEPPRQPFFGGYDPRPQLPPDSPRRPEYGGYDPRPPVYPSRPKDSMLNIMPGGRYQGIGELGGSGPVDYVIGEDGVLCAPTCRGLCIIRDRDCNCIQNQTCFNEYKHRLDFPPSDALFVPSPCPNEIDCSGPCDYIVRWPDRWCMCEQKPNCDDDRYGSRTYTKREADLQKLILQRDAHMEELKRASRQSSTKTKRQAGTLTQIFN